MKLASPVRIVANTFVVVFIAFWFVAGFTSAEASGPGGLFAKTVELAAGNPMISGPLILVAVAFVLFGNSGGEYDGVRFQLGNSRE